MMIKIANLGLMNPFGFLDRFHPNPGKKSLTCLKAGSESVLFSFVWLNLINLLLSFHNKKFDSFILNSFTQLKYEIKKEISSNESRKGKKHDFSRVQLLDGVVYCIEKISLCCILI
jgi:hypothetical protein